MLPGLISVFQLFKATKTMKHLFPILIHLIICTSMLTGYGPQAQAQDDPPVAIKGVLDLRHWDFNRNGIADLSGEWRFFWRQLLSPSDFKREPALESTGGLSLPGYWNTFEIDGKPLSGAGYATLVLDILLPEKHDSLAFMIRDIQTAYLLFVNGEKAVAVGSVGTERKNATPRYSPVVVDVRSEDHNLNLVLQISNFHHRKGGVFESIHLGREEDVRDTRETRLVVEIFLAGCIFIMALYHLGLYLLRRRDNTALYFSVFCALIATRAIITGERYIDQLLPNVHWEFIHKIEYLSFYLAVPAFALYIRSIFPQEFSKKILRTIQAITFLFSLIVVVTAGNIYSHMVQTYEVFTLLAGIYLFYVLALTMKRKREGSVILLVGFVFLWIIVANDILHANQVIHTAYLLPVGIFMFILSQALLISLRFSKMFQVVENQTMELTKTNDAYRMEIVERKKLEQSLLESHDKFERSRIAIILGLAKLAEYRDENTGMHLERMREYSRILAKALSTSPEYKGYITEAYIDDLYQSAILHDIGKVGVSDSVLLKPGKLNDQEFEIIKNHCTIGGDAILNVESRIKIQSFLTLGKEIAYNHHEKWNGSGYPHGLKEEKIPLSARIVALADVYDALTSERPYKKAFSHDKAKSIILAGDGQHFDPKIVQAFILQEEEFDKIRKNFGDK